MANYRVLIAGFGGQGILFGGKLLAYSGLIAEKEVSWLPSYGPEMRGGTASCSVIVSDSPVGSPIVNEPDILIAMNLPSLEKYKDSVVSGGYIFYDSSLIDKGVDRKDVKVFPIPATRLADELGYNGLSNMIILGKAIKETDILPFAEIEKGMSKVVPAKKMHLLGKNVEAVKIGYDYKG